MVNMAYEYPWGEIGSATNTTALFRQTRHACLLARFESPSRMLVIIMLDYSSVASQPTRYQAYHGPSSAAVRLASGDSFQISIESAIPCGWLPVKDVQGPSAAEC